MFQQLTNLGLQRDGNQAVGFYVAFFVVGVLLGIFVGGFVGSLYPESTSLKDVTAAGARTGAIVASILALGVGLKILSKKNQLEFGWVTLVVASAIVAQYIGALVAFVPIAYITTLPNLSHRATHSARKKAAKK